MALVADDVPLDRRSLVLVGALAGLALWALASVAWSSAAAWPVLEAERGLLYATAAGALVLVVTRARVASLVAGIVAGATIVSLYALATRLFPGQVGGPYDPAGGYQLAAPIGYWTRSGCSSPSACCSAQDSGYTGARGCACSQGPRSSRSPSPSTSRLAAGPFSSC